MRRGALNMNRERRPQAFAATPPSPVPYRQGLFTHYYSGAASSAQRSTCELHQVTGIHTARADTPRAVLVLLTLNFSTAPPTLF